MTLIDELKILDNKIRANQTQYSLDREAAKISTLSPNELDKYEYLTVEVLGYKPGVVEGKIEYSPLGVALNSKAKSKTDKTDKADKIDKTGNRNKKLIYNPQYSFSKFRDINHFKEILLDYMCKRLQNYHKKFVSFKKVSLQTKKNKDLKVEVLDNTGNLFNELHYVYKERYREEKDASNKKIHK